MNKSGVIELENVYKQSPARVWKALTEPELHAHWWAPGDVKAIVGHRFELDMGPFGKQLCEVLEVVPEQLFKYRFSVGRLDTTLTWRLVAEGNGTRLRLTHEGFDLESPFGRQAYDGMKPGWPTVLERLGSALDGG